MTGLKSCVGADAGDGAEAIAPDFLNSGQVPGWIKAEFGL